jgi:hypothetical protein
MTIHVASEKQVIQEAAQVLMTHMSPAKATRFWLPGRLAKAIIL